MASITWAAGQSGNWNAATDWTGGVVPGPGDTAEINAAGRYIVTLDTPVTVAGLILDYPPAKLLVESSLNCNDIQL